MSQHSQENTCARVYFLIINYYLASLLKKGLWNRCFPVNFAKLLVRVPFLKVQPCKLYNNKYMTVSTQITNTEIFAFVTALVFNLLSRKV